MSLLKENDKSPMPGGQLTDYADFPLCEALNVQLQWLLAASLCKFVTSHLPPGPRVYLFTTPEAYCCSHLPGTMYASFCFRDSLRGG